MENRPEDNSSRRFSAFPLDHGPATAIESVDRGRWMSKKLRIFRGEKGGERERVLPSLAKLLDDSSGGSGANRGRGGRKKEAELISRH